MQELLKSIRLYKNEKKKVWWENYVKHATKFLGIPMADLRRCLKVWSPDNFTTLSHNDQYALITELFSCDYAEEKLLGILLLAEHVQWKDHQILDLIEEVMDRGHIYDWNICDWLCVKVLTPRINHEISTRLVKWSTASYLWQRRAALVPYAQIKNHGDYEKEIFIISKALIQYEERFSKTAVGWVMREMMPSYEDKIIQFMREEYQYMTTEVINNILKHHPDKKTIKSQLQS